MVVPWRGVPCPSVPDRSSTPPLSARSVVVSVLLGARADGMTARQLVAAGTHFGLSAATVRVALSRAVAAEDLQRTGSTYRLGTRLLARRARQELPARTAWDGTWEMVVVVATGRPPAERAALRDALAAAHLAELRDGVWVRPANLDRPPPSPGGAVAQAFTATPTGDPAALVRTAWDLDRWQRETDGVLALLEAANEPAERLAVAARLVRHLRTDPLLPDELWPPGWPSQRAQQASAAFEAEVSAVARL